MKKIAFCFLIYDHIENGELWNIFFQNIDESMYNIYIHYKINRPLKYFEKYKLDNCIETKYADVTLIHAHNLLFKKAYDDGCYKIISLSQSCIPFKSFHYIYDFLTANNYSHFNVMPQTQCFPRCDTLVNYYDLKYIQKSYNWFILNREMCNIVTSYTKEQINTEYGYMCSPEEIFFITTLFYHNLQNEIVMTPNLSNDATTFTNWEGMDYKYPSLRGLKNYTFISEEELNHLINSKCLFGRKFRRECLVYLLNKTYIQAINLLV
jgi:hypothetical protein